MMLQNIEIAYARCLPWNTECKYKRYKCVISFITLYLKQTEVLIKNTKNFNMFLNIFCCNRIYKNTLPNKLFLKLKRVMKRCWPVCFKYYKLNNFKEF